VCTHTHTRIRIHTRAHANAQESVDYAAFTVDDDKREISVVTQMFAALGSSTKSLFGFGGGDSAAAGGDGGGKNKPGTIA
jgi:hypothetical protein